MTPVLVFILVAIAVAVLFAINVYNGLQTLKTQINYAVKSFGYGL